MSVVAKHGTTTTTGTGVDASGAAWSGTTGTTGLPLNADADAGAAAGCMVGTMIGTGAFADAAAKPTMSGWEACACGVSSNALIPP